jgi:hypothetical protein
VRSFCTVFSRRPHGTTRAADSVPWPTLTLPLPLRPGQRRSAGAKRKDLGAAISSRVRSRGGFDKGTLAMAQIGLMRTG